MSNHELIQTGRDAPNNDPRNTDYRVPDPMNFDLQTAELALRWISQACGLPKNLKTFAEAASAIELMRTPTTTSSEEVVALERQLEMVIAGLQNKLPEIPPDAHPAVIGAEAAGKALAVAKQVLTLRGLLIGDPARALRRANGSSLSMSISEYQRRAAALSYHQPTRGHDLKEELTNVALGLSGEFGELVESPRDFNIECGDLLWYISEGLTAFQQELSDQTKTKAAWGQLERLGVLSKGPSAIGEYLLVLIGEFNDDVKKWRVPGIPLLPWVQCQRLMLMYLLVEELCNHNGTSINEIAYLNIQKLEARHKNRMDNGNDQRA